MASFLNETEVAELLNDRWFREKQKSGENWIKDVGSYRRHAGMVNNRSAFSIKRVAKPMVARWMRRELAINFKDSHCCEFSLSLCLIISREIHSKSISIIPCYFTALNMHLFSLEISPLRFRFSVFGENKKRIHNENNFNCLVYYF